MSADVLCIPLSLGARACVSLSAESYENKPSQKRGELSLRAGSYVVCSGLILQATRQCKLAFSGLLVYEKGCSRDSQSSCLHLAAAHVGADALQDV
mgnify:CR=1 FL=1